MENSLRGSRVLITGGAGAIGSNLCDLVVQAGAREIVVLDNFVRGRRDEPRLGPRRTGPSRSSKATSATELLVDELTDGIDVVFHQAAIRITQCAEEPRLAMEVMVDGTFNVLEAAVAARSARSSRRRRRRSTASPTTFPTTEAHHPYANDTLYGAAKVFNEGLLRSFHEMYGLDYVALRYFNVYGPRMDVHGVYTEVLIRWMERIAAGTPPLILGDGSQTMDFVYVDDVARANVLAAEPDVTDEVFNVASGIETSLLELARHAAGGDGLRPRGRVRARARRQHGAAAPGGHAARAPRARLHGRDRPRGRPARPRRLVARGARAEPGGGAT